MKNIISVFIFGFLCVVCSIVGFFLSNFILTELWAWFVVPVFSVPQISMVQCMGLVLLTGYVLRSNLMINGSDSLKAKFEGKSPSKIFGIVFGYAILSPLLAWFIGYVITLFL